MNSTIVLAVGVSVLLGVASGCGSTETVDPLEPAPPLAPRPPYTPPAAPPPAPPPSPAPPFPALSRPGVVYVEQDPLYEIYALVSRYVLYEDGQSVLQFSSARHGFFEYAGHYVRTDSLLALTFDGHSPAGPMLAQAVVTGDTLVVRYNAIMMFSDFNNGIYVRSPPPP